MAGEPVFFGSLEGVPTAGENILAFFPHFTPDFLQFCMFLVSGEKYMNTIYKLGEKYVFPSIWFGHIFVCVCGGQNNIQPC